VLLINVDGGAGPAKSRVRTAAAISVMESVTSCVEKQSKTLTAFMSMI
jgi:hypothetical protein